ncbi:queuosine salvage family protein [Bacteroidota bacterium]
MRSKKIDYWTKHCPVQFTDYSQEDLLKVLFLFNSTSFSYWKEKPWIVTYQDNNSERGSWSNFLAIKRAVDEGIPFLDVNYQAEVSNKELTHIWRAKESIPMLEIRADFVRKNARKLIDSYQGNLLNLIEESNYDAVNLTNILLENFDTFEDSSIYKGREVTFNKRAQLFSADVHYLIHKLSGVGELSGCADYKIPITQEYHGVLEFSRYLTDMIRKKKLISEEIVTEVRANELMGMELTAGEEYTAMESNNFYWVTWQEIPKEKRNYLRFRSTGC